MIVTREDRVDLFSLSSAELVDLFLECVQHQARSSSPAAARRMREDIRGALVARCDGKTPPFRIGNRVRPRGVPLYPLEFGANGTALHDTASRTVVDMGYDARQKTWWIELKDGWEEDGVTPRFRAQDLDLVIARET